MLSSKRWMIFSSLLILFGLVGAANVIIHGEDVVGTNNYVAWGALIAGYVFFVVSSTGLSLVSALGHVFKIQRYEVIAKRAVLGSILTLVMGFVVIALELGKPLNMVWILVSPNFQSAIFWMGLLYGLYLVLLGFEFFYMIKGNHKKSSFFGLLVLISAIAAHSNLGAVFGFLVTRPYWHGPYMSIYFILSALLSGSAILSVMFYIVSKTKTKEDLTFNHEHIVSSLGKLLALFLAITMFFTIWKVLTGLYGHVPGKYEAIMAIMNGPLAIRFWVFEILIGMVIPFVLLLSPGGFQPKRVFYAGSMTILGIFFMRLDLVAAGQVVPVQQVKGMLVETYRSTGVTWSEWAIILGAIGGTILLYLIGEKMFNLNMGEHHDTHVIDSKKSSVQA